MNRLYRERGYVSGLRVFSEAEMRDHNAELDRLEAMLLPGETPYVIDGWEKHNLWLYRLALEPRILDLVQSVLGPDFFQWGSNMMCKAPHEALYVPWHQDLADWPLSPPRALTVWIAFDDTDEENGCMRVIPGTHRRGLLPHLDSRPAPRKGSRSLFPFHADPSCFDEAESVPVILGAGEVSLHDCQLIHGSDGNLSPRRRRAFTLCYAAAEVVCDRSFSNQNGVWDRFAVFPCRGRDPHGRNPIALPPAGFGRTASRAYRLIEEER
jgi:non-haem Fe2+, alpha-ketoglutarate-dependent halogenase